MTERTKEKIWANSADSHFLEPENLWRDNAPASMADLMPRSEKDPDGAWETLHIEGRSFRRRLPTGANQEFRTASWRAAGARDPNHRLKDLDGEGVWAEVIYPSLGMWNASFRSSELLRQAIRISNDWVADTVLRASPRLLPTAQLPLLVVDDAVAELQRAASMGFVAAFLTTSPHPQQEDYHRDVWEPLWAAAEEAGIVLAFHIGSDPLDLESGQLAAATFRGPGSAVLNYAETTFSGQRAAMKLVASGALDRHPALRVLISEGGAGWVPFMADRMEEGYRQHSTVVRPKLTRSPREILYSQVYVSFQHDVSGVTAMTAGGYRNVAWGSDYPHQEGTFGHTQEVLHGLFDDVDPSVRQRITVGAFQELFPTVAPAPIDADGRLVVSSR